MTLADFREHFTTWRFWAREFIYWRLQYQPRRYRRGLYRFDGPERPVLDGYRKVLVIRINHSYAGFFAYFTFAINQILFCERNRCYPVVYFGPWSGDGENAYHEEAVGENMWEYYFEPVSKYGYEDIKRFLADPNHPLQEQDVVSLDEDDLWYLHTFEQRSVYAYSYGRHILKNRRDEAWSDLQRRRAHDIVERYIRIRKPIVDRVNAFYEAFMHGRTVLGAHLRGTDKGAAAASVSAKKKLGPDHYYPEIDRYLAQHADALIFVATDQRQYLEQMRERYGERIIATDCLRTGGDLAPFQVSEGSGYEKGAEVLVDALLLARCQYLLKSASHVGEAALWFNPALPVRDLSFD